MSARKAPTAPVERKVKVASAAAAVAGLIDWVLDTYVFHGGGVPQAVQAIILLAVPAILTFAGGYLSKHTPRPGVAPAAPAPPPSPAPPNSPMPPTQVTPPPPDERGSVF